MPFSRMTAILLTAILAILPAALAAAQTVDYSAYAALLSRYVSGDAVNYAALKQNEAELDRVLDSFARVAPDTLSLDGQKAFYINAYNAWTLKLVLNHYPLKSIRDLGGVFGSPWKIEFVRMDGNTTTLAHIEHGLLRPLFKDPRVHAAINCASKGCPPLRPLPYTEEGLDMQLDKAASGFVNDPARNRLEGDTLYTNAIFNWFEADFGGEPGVREFFRRYGSPQLKAGLEKAGDDLKIETLKYDWSLNGK